MTSFFLLHFFFVLGSHSTTSNPSESNRTQSTSNDVWNQGSGILFTSDEVVAPLFNFCMMEAIHRTSWAALVIKLFSKVWISANHPPFSAIDYLVIITKIRTNLTCKLCSYLRILTNCWVLSVLHLDFLCAMVICDMTSQDLATNFHPSNQNLYFGTGCSIISFS